MGSPDNDPTSPKRLRRTEAFEGRKAHPTNWIPAFPTNDVGTGRGNDPPSQCYGGQANTPRQAPSSLRYAGQAGG
jgi:hypothetical protein